MQKCKICECEFDDFEVMYEINTGFEDEYIECFNCHVEAMEYSITTCNSCGEYFSGEHLKINSVNGEQEICPYCDEIWCD